MENLEIGIDHELSLRQNKIDGIVDLIQKNKGYLRLWVPWVDTYLKSVDDLTAVSLDESLTEEERETKIQDLQKSQDSSQESYFFGIWYQQLLLGAIDVHNIDRTNRSGEIGYWLDEEYQGKGIVTRSAAALVRYSFEELQLHRVYMKCGSENQKSQQVPKRLGFVPEGVERESELFPDGFRDQKVYSLLEHEYKIHILQNPFYNLSVRPASS